MKATLSLEIVDASRIDGCGEFITFNRIILPMMKPAVATQLIFTFISSWNAYYMPTMLLSRQQMYTLPMDGQSRTRRTGGKRRYSACERSYHPWLFRKTSCWVFL